MPDGILSPIEVLDSSHQIKISQNSIKKDFGLFENCSYKNICRGNLFSLNNIFSICLLKAEIDKSPDDKILHKYFDPGTYVKFTKVQIQFKLEKLTRPYPR